VGPTAATITAAWVCPMSAAPVLPCADGSAEHRWEGVPCEPGRLLIAVAVCTRCGARQLVYQHDEREVVRYARPPRWGTPADFQPSPPPPLPPP
jgi:hypothetical protein